MRLEIFIITFGFLISLSTHCDAAGTGLSGNLEAGPTYQSGSGDTLFESSLTVKMDINKDEKQSGTVILQYKAKTPETEDDSEGGYNTLVVNQAYVDLSLSSQSMLRLGRQKISWGSGLAWNPTNYIGADKNRTDLANEFPGVDAAQFETVFGQSSLAVVVKPVNSFNAWGEAVKYATRLGRNDLAFSVFRQNGANAFGADWATSLGDYTVYSEIASKAGTGRFYFTESGGRVIRAIRSDDQRYFNGVLGINRTFANGILVQLEYYHNEAGWNTEETGYYHRYLNDPSNRAETGELYRQTADLFGDLRQNYLYFLIQKAEVVADLTLTARVLWNMDDGSWMMTPMAEYRLGQNSTVTFLVNLFIGDETTEFCGIPAGTQYAAKVNLSF